MSNEIAQAALSASDQSATSALPNEILEQIFEEVVLSVTIAEQNYPPRRESMEPRYPENLCRVSRHWYTIGQNHAVLWSFIEVVVQYLGPYPSRASYVRNRIKRSGTVPLHVRIGWKHSEEVEAMEAVVGPNGSNMARWETAYIRCDTGEDMEAPWLGFPTPILRKLEINIPDVLSKPFLPFTPRLTELKMAYPDYEAEDLLYFDNQRLNITTLSLWAGYNEPILDQLRRFPNLSKLTIQISWYELEGFDYDKTPVSLPALKELILQQGSDLMFLRFLDIPNFADVVVHNEGSYGWESILVPINYRSLFFLESFCETVESFANFFRRNPHLEKLKCRDVTTAMHPSEMTYDFLEDASICPNLRVCDLGDPERDAKFVEMRGERRMESGVTGITYSDIPTSYKYTPYMRSAIEVERLMEPSG